MSTIREQIIAAITTKLADITIENGYATNVGLKVERVRPVFQPAELPATSVIPQAETAERICGKVVCTMPVTIEGSCLHGEVNPSVMAEKILGDFIACLTEIERLLSFTSGDKIKIRQGNVIRGATSAAAARVVAVNLVSGIWADGNAAGTLRVRMQSGTFQAENLNIGTSLNVATIAGNSIVIIPLGGLIDDIFYSGGGPESYPESGQDVTGCPATFVVKYKTLLGNPSAQ